MLFLIDSCVSFYSSSNFPNFSVFFLQGLVAFSENGLMIRWWSLGSVWWEKLNRNLVPVRCSKLILVPEWEGFSPNSTRTSIMASLLDENGHIKSPVILLTLISYLSA